MTLETAYRLFRDRVLIWARRAGVPECDVEDIAHEVFRFFETSGTNVPDRAVATWLHTATTHRAMHHARKRAIRERLAHRCEASAEGSQEPSPEHALGGCEVEAVILDLVAGLEPRRREAFVLSFAIAYESTAPKPAPAVGCDAACRAQIRAEVRAELCRENPRSCNVDIIPVLLAGGALSVGLTADPGGGAWLGGELRFGEIFSTALEARVLFPSRVVPTADEPFALSMVSFGLVPCGRWKWLLGCVSADIGMFIGGGIYAPSGLPILATFGVGPRVGGQIPITERLGIRAFADLRIAPVPTRFGFQDSPGTWESNPVSGFFGVGLTFE